MTDEPWVDRYRPETLGDVQGNNSAIEDIEEWADGWEPGDQGILLHGPPGVGKTTTAEAVANRLDLQTVEVNASSARSTEDLKTIARRIQTAGGGERAVVILDEVDSWHHAVDKTALYDALDSPANPVVMTANDEYEVAGGLKSRATLFEFKLGKRSRLSRLKDIRDAEDLDLTDDDLEPFAERPDLRSAINDLQIVVEQDGPAGADQREWETSEWDMLDDVLTGTPDLGDVSPPDALMWLDECCSATYRGLEMAMAYEAMAMADVRLGVAQERGYRHWRYARAMLEEVAFIRETEPYFGDEIGYNDKSFPEWFRHSAPDATGGSDEAKLYRALKGYDEPGFEFQGSFTFFREGVLPILRDLPEEEIYQMLLSVDVPEDAYSALDVTPGEFRDWVEDEEPEAGEWEPDVADGSAW